MLLDGIGVDAVIEFGKLAVKVPVERKARVLVGFQSFVVFDNVELEFRRNPTGEFKRNVGMRKNAAPVASRLGYDAYSTQMFIPFLYGKGVGIGSCIFFKRIEIVTFKIGVVQAFPQSKKFHDVAAAKPTMYGNARGRNFCNERYPSARCIRF